MLSVVINTYNRPQALEGCLKALAGDLSAQEGDFEVVIVDDGGTTDLCELEGVWREPLNLRLLRIEHRGRAGARNAGVEAARGERILMLGDDVEVEPGCVGRHRCVTNPEVAVVGPYPLEDLSGSAPFRRWAEPNPQHRILDHANAGFFFFATGNLSMDRRRYLDLGGMDPRFEVYGWEDIDLGLRFERSGGRIIFDPEARARHRHPQLSREQLWQREYEMGITAWQFCEKWQDDAPEVVEEMRFWGDPADLKPAARWRRWLGDRLIGLAERLAPESRLNAALYERMIFAHRLSGVAEAWHRWGRSS